MTLRRRLALAAAAGVLFGAATVFFSSPEPIVQSARAKALAVLHSETIDRPATKPELNLKRGIASGDAPSSTATNTPQFNCLVYLRGQIEDYDLYVRRLENSQDSRVGSWYFYHDEDLNHVEEKSASGLFLLGLARAGLLDGNSSEPNLPLAIENLKQAHKLDPGNSAPLVFLAALADQRGDPAAAKKYRAQIKSTTRFDSYIMPLVNGVYDTIESPSDYINAAKLWSSASIPNYPALGKYLKEQKLVKVADQILAAQNFDGESELDFLFIEGAVAVSTLKHLQPERAGSLPVMRDVMRRFVERQSSLIWGDVPEEDCNLSRLDPEVARLARRKQRRHGD